jgi:lipopolysaccharide/colanic/teichoic acid biosynthesis glycosyltransferase
MYAKEITLINLQKRTAGLMRQWYHVSNYSDLEGFLVAINYRMDNDFDMPDFIVLDATKVDQNTFEAFRIIMKQQNLDIPTVIVDENPTSEKMKLYKALGAGDYLDSCATDMSIVRQIQRLGSTDKKDIESNKYIYKISLAKRAFDIFFSSIILILISPLLLLVMLAIRLESKGPIFYWQPRVGTGYRIFNFYKFRSTRVNADQLLDKMSNLNHYAQQDSVQEANTGHFSETELIGDNTIISEDLFLKEKESATSKSFNEFENDPRITKVGQWIRKTSIDELPQLFNVLLGDMSLVGNRPLPLSEAETLTSDDWVERFLAPTGITGLWQVTKRGKKATSADSRKQLDNEYARKHNLLMDIKILLKTPLAAIQQDNV